LRGTATVNCNWWLVELKLRDLTDSNSETHNLVLDFDPPV